MEEKRNKELHEKMLSIVDLIEQGVDRNQTSVDTITFYQDFEFTQSGFKDNNVFVAKVQNLKDSTTTYEIYSESSNSLIATVNEHGKLHFMPEYIEKLREDYGKYFTRLKLEDSDFELPDELQVDDVVLTKSEMAQSKEEKQHNSLQKGMVKETSQEDKEQQEESEEQETKASEEESQKEEIANKKGIPTHSILFVRANSNFYKDHPELESNLYFYRDNSGVVKAEYIDENGNSQPSKFFEDSQTSLRQETVSIGNDGNPVTKNVPYQVMRTKGLNSIDKDIRDIRININIDSYGYLDIEEARQGQNGEWLSHDIELNGRDYNSRAVNETTSIRSRKADPSKQTEGYEKAQANEVAKEDGIQYDEMYLAAHADQIIQSLVDEGYQREEAISIFNYMLGEENLSMQEARARVDKEIENKFRKKEEDIQGDEEEGNGENEGGSTVKRQPGGRSIGEDAYERRFNI